MKSEPAQGLAHIRALAEEYASKYNPARISPFPYEHVMQAHDDLKLYFTELDDPLVSGVILFKDDEFNILINIAKPSTRQNFTVGHELGHYFLHKDILRADQGIIDGDDTLDGSKILYRKDGIKDNALVIQVEKEANNFAASLIMPSALVYRVWEATQSIEECARIFTVSVVAMSVRLTELGMISE
jgi:Zn-dependent peptidase ImmA (M78 family)